MQFKSLAEKLSETGKLNAPSFSGRDGPSADGGGADQRRVLLVDVVGHRGVTLLEGLAQGQEEPAHLRGRHVWKLISQYYSVDARNLRTTH